jgi:uncharacterized protein
MIPEKIKDRLPQDLILLGYRGSHSHGMYIPKDDPNSIDDIDLMGVFIAPLEHYLGFGRREVVESFPDEWDIVCYEFRKFIGLLARNNPNVLALLWLDPQFILFENEVGRRLRHNRGLFVSRLAYASFTGYATSQLRRMTHLNQQALAEIERREQELRGFCTFEGVTPRLPAGASPERIERLRQYEELRAKYFSGYMGHKRRALVQKLGYDAKNAAHLIRLLRMGIEFLETGGLQVLRPDARELLEIKRGEWSLERVKDEAERLFRVAEEAYGKSNLPEEPDREKIEAFCVSVLREHFSA